MGFVWVAAAACLMWLLQSLLYQHFWMRGLSARLEFGDEAIREGECGTLKEIIENRKILPLPVLQVGFTVDRSLRFLSSSNVSVSDQAYRRDIFALLPWQRITRTLEFQAQKRGYYRCGKLELVGKDLFLEGSFVQKEDTDAAIYVYPKPVFAEQSELVCREMLGEFFWKKKLYEDPFAVQGIRDYEIWDGFRQVNWKASARSGELKVNIYENTALPSVLILLNLEQEEIWEEEILTESVIRIGAALAHQWISLGVPVAVRTNGRDLLTKQYAGVDAGAGACHLDSVLKMLSRVQTADVKAVQERKKRRDPVNPFWEESQTQMILYVSSGTTEENRNYLQQCAAGGAGVLWIQPVLKHDRKGSASDRATDDSGLIPHVQWRIEA